MAVRLVGLLWLAVLVSACRPGPQAVVEPSTMPTFLPPEPTRTPYPEPYQPPTPPPLVDPYPEP